MVFPCMLPDAGLVSQWFTGVVQKAVFHLPKDGLSGCKRWPFATRKTVFCTRGGAEEKVRYVKIA